MDYKIKKIKKFSDKRGDLIVFLKQSDLDKKDQQFGQIYFVTFKNKNVIRGNHYHLKWREWFGVVSGKVKAKLKDIKTGEEKTLYLDSNENEYVLLEIGPYIAHAFQSVTNEAQLLNYANAEWSQEDCLTHKLIEFSGNKK